ncbi:unnamed protein product [Rodentolepis nana]|uniref:Uncharacterized protein n=1 Tax=Rodentolepis nana TaxID=102285 RepID=A0A0R3U0V7_RODNA|nr:unnamed protein product [Rodentolepis nana]VDO16883.1 unnamed protein product [Rodentolepis nana]
MPKANLLSLFYHGTMLSRLGYCVKLKVVSADGGDGFPGNLTVYITYRLSENEEDQRVSLLIDYLPPPQYI